VLLFVSAHWDQLGPGERITLVLLMVAVFHAGGAAAAGRFESLSVTLHTIGTVALGAGIALTGQIFHLSDHWPSAILLWAAGAAMAWILLRHWTQAALVAILVPYWLAAEWEVRVSGSGSDDWAPVAAGICALSFTYLSARRAASDGALRKALGWLGGIALVPAAAAAAAVAGTFLFGRAHEPQAVAWSVAAILPLALAVALHRRQAVWTAIAIVWALVLPQAGSGQDEHLMVYIWCALGSIGLAWWGVRESRTERINLGVAGFAITLLTFYFSSVMDKMGRSASLILLGLLFLGGGWALERTRRRLISQIRPEAI